MSNKNRPGDVRIVPSRSGDVGTGAFVRVTHNPSGTTVMEIDGSRFALPQEGFIADFASAVDSSEGVKMLFAKAHPINHAATALVEVLVPWRIFLETLWPSIGDAFVEKLVAYCKRIAPDWKADPVEKLEEARYQARRASFAQLAYTQDEAEIDFHLITAVPISRAATNGNVEVEPVLRVLLSAPLLAELLLKLQALVAGKKKGGG